MNASLRHPLVTRAVLLIVVSFLTGIMKAAVDWQHLTEPMGASFVVLVAVFNLALFGLLAWKIYQGRNWARVTLLVLFILGVIPSFFSVRAELHRSIWLGLVSVLQIAIQLYVLVLLFTFPGKNWFKLSSADPALSSSLRMN